MKKQLKTLQIALYGSIFAYEVYRIWCRLFDVNERTPWELITGKKAVTSKKKSVYPKLDIAQDGSIFVSPRDFARTYARNVDKFNAMAGSN